MGLQPLRGSRARTLAGATVAGRVSEPRRIEVTLHLRRRSHRSRLPVPVVEPHRPRRHLTHDEFEAAHGADEADIATAVRFARRRGLSVGAVRPGARTIVLAGPATLVGDAFGVQLVHYKTPDIHHHGHDGPVRLPAAVADTVDGVFGLDNRPVARPYFRAYDSTMPPDPLHPPLVASYTAPEVARLYRFPDDLDGAGQCIAILQLGGGYKRRDLETYFTRVGTAVPTIRSVSVNGARNRPIGRLLSDDMEVALDVEIAGSIAPGARIVVYFAPNDDRGYIDALRTAIHDRRHRPSVISLSWGNAEKAWTSRTRRVLNRLFHEASLMVHHRLRGVGRPGVERRSDGARRGRLSGIESICSRVRGNPFAGARDTHSTRGGLERQPRWVGGVWRRLQRGLRHTQLPAVHRRPDGTAHEARGPRCGSEW